MSSLFNILNSNLGAVLHFHSLSRARTKSIEYDIIFACYSW